MTEHKNIHEALLAIMKEVSYVQRDGKITKGGTYTYASEAAFISAVRPLLLEHGVIVYPTTSNQPSFQTDTYTTRNGGTMNSVVIKQGYKIVHVASGTEIYTHVFGMGADAGDKAIGKAMTNAFKYMIRQSLFLETGDDPDKTPSVEQERVDQKELMTVNALMEQLDDESYPDKHMTEGEKSRWLDIVKERLLSGDNLSNAVGDANSRYFNYKNGSN